MPWITKFSIKPVYCSKFEVMSFYDREIQCFVISGNDCIDQYKTYRQDLKQRSDLNKLLAQDEILTIVYFDRNFSNSVSMFIMNDLINSYQGIATLAFYFDSNGRYDNYKIATTSCAKFLIDQTISFRWTNRYTVP